MPYKTIHKFPEPVKLDKQIKGFSSKCMYHSNYYKNILILNFVPMYLKKRCNLLLTYICVTQCKLMAIAKNTLTRVSLKNL